MAGKPPPRPVPVPPRDEPQRPPLPLAPPKAPLPLAPQGAGMQDYLREAFLFKWNLLFFLGGTAAAAMAPFAAAMLPLVAAGELLYLTGLVSVPRFRAAIDAKVHGAGKDGADFGSAPPQPAQSLLTMLGGIPKDARARFERLHGRCVEMRGIAAGVRGAAGDQRSTEEIATPGLDRLLWLFLRLLLSKTALDRFLQSMSEKDISTRLDDLRKNMATAQTANDERIVKSLQDSIAMAELRLDNFGRAKKNAEFVAVELDRIEEKIQALAEMSVNRQDPDFLTSQVDNAAESMRQTEKAVSELQHLTGLGDELQEPPAILNADLREVLRNDA